ncbi:MAG TPA: ATP phosphoribosyltransferase [Gammaproteobacteria bacterium]|nr:ATP phosphoribosyltransferase [Gammaproteobacteria bacterium]
MKMKKPTKTNLKRPDPGAPLTLAVSKGRILDEALPLLARIGIKPLEDPGRSRKLILKTSRPELRLVIIRAQDVPTYVEHGAAEAGIAGRDVLMEYQSEELYEPLDLGIARCRLVVAGRDRILSAVRPRVATKYPNITRAYFAARGEQAEIIKLYGSMELAPLAGLADRIVDLVNTGRTLRDNGLVELSTIAEISARLIVNKAAMKVKHVAVQKLTAQLAKAIRS